MWLKLFLFSVALVNVKAVDNFIDENGRVLLQLPSRKEGSRYFQVQRGPDGDVTGFLEVQPSRQSVQPVLSRGQEQEIVKNYDSKDDLILVDIENNRPLQFQPQRDIIIEEEQHVKLPAPSPPRDILVINERPVQVEPQPKPEARPVVFTHYQVPAPRPIPQPFIISSAPKLQPAPSQVVVMPAKQQIQQIPATRTQPEPVMNYIVETPVKPEPEPRPIPQPAIIASAPKPQPAPSQVVVIPAQQQIQQIPAAKPQPKPVMNYIVKTPVQPEPESRPVVNVINNQLFDYQCRSANGYFALKNQCNRFVECKEFKAYYYDCPDGMNFNRNAVWPNYPCGNSREVHCESQATIIDRSPLVTRECPSPYGLYSLPDNECSNYISCKEGIATLMACPKGLVFNPTEQACDWLENMPSCRPTVFSGVTCPSALDETLDFEPKYRYGQSCTEYISCHRGVPRLLKCDDGLAFDAQSERCVGADHVLSCSY